MHSLSHSPLSHTSPHTRHTLPTSLTSFSFTPHTVCALRAAPHSPLLPRASHTHVLAANGRTAIMDARVSAARGFAHLCAEKRASLRASFCCACHLSRATRGASTAHHRHRGAQDILAGALRCVLRTALRYKHLLTRANAHWATRREDAISIIIALRSALSRAASLCGNTGVGSRSYPPPHTRFTSHARALFTHALTAPHHCTHAARHRISWTYRGCRTSRISRFRRADAQRTALPRGLHLMV